MSDASRSDDQNLAEQVDTDKLGHEFPPEAPLGVEEYGVTARQEAVDEPLEERVAREQPDVGAGSISPDDEVGELVQPDAGARPDEEDQAVAGEVGRPHPPAGPGGPGAEAVTTDDIATERAPDLAPEDEAVHPTEPPPMGEDDGYV